MRNGDGKLCRMELTREKVGLASWLVGLGWVVGMLGLIALAI